MSFLVPRIRPELPHEESVEGCCVVRYDKPDLLRRQANLRLAFGRLNSLTPVDAVLVHFAYTAWAYHALRLSQRIPTVRLFQGPWDRETAVERGLLRDTADGGGAMAAPRPRDRIAVGVTFLIERYSLRRSHRVVTLSEYMASEARGRFGVPASKVSVIPPGVDTTVFAPGDRVRARERLGLAPGAFIVLSVRRLARRMGLDLLLRAAQRVRRERADMLVLIAGNGPMRAELETLARELGLAGSVRFAGFVPDELLPDYYRAADVFLLPTVALEGFGLVTLEALACGTPVLGTPVAAIPEVLSQFDPDLVLPGVTSEAIATGILAFQRRHTLDLPDYRQAVLANCRWEQAADRLLAVVEEIRSNSR